MPKRGGAGVVAEELAKAASAMGHKVKVFMPKSGVDAVELPYATQEIPNRGTLGWGCCRKTYRRLVQMRTELSQGVIHLVEPGSILTYMYGQLMGRLPEAEKLILTFHGSEILRFCRFPHRLLLCWLLKKVDVVHFLSHSCMRLFQERFVISDDKVFVLPGAARSLVSDDTGFPSIPNSEGRAVCLTVARIHPRKGQHISLNALKKLPEALKERVEYWIVGPVVDSSYQKRLSNEAKQSGLIVHFIGEVSDMHLSSIYDQADIFIMTSVPYKHSIEGFGLVYLEAASHGLPVVGHRIGGVEEAVSDGKTGILCESNDLDALTASLTRMIDDAPMRKKMSAQSLEFARTFSWEKMAGGLYD